MARIEFSSIVFKAKPNNDVYNDREVRPLIVERNHSKWSEPAGRYSMHDVTIKRVATRDVWTSGITLEIPQIIMTAEEREKFPPLPQGYCFTYVDHGLFPDDYGCVGLHWDVTHLETFVQEQLDRIVGPPNPVNAEPSADAIVRDHLECYSSAVQSALTTTFNINSDIDRVTKFGPLGEDSEIHISDGGEKVREVYPHSKLENGGIAEIWEYWLAERAVHHLEGLDANMAAPAMRNARKAFGSTKNVELAKAYIPKGRRLILELDPRVAFPVDCKFDQWNQTLLVFKMTETGFRKPMQDFGVAFWTDDCVFIHREGGITRFVFWENRIHLLPEKPLATQMSVVYVMPIFIPDTECTVSAPLSPQRGMDPQVTRAVAQNPYFASAFQHAMHRRAYLRSKLPAEGDVVDLNPEVPVLVRSRDGNLKGDYWSRIGRRNARNKFHMADVTTKALFEGCGENEILFDEPRVHPVADVEEKVNRRALQLDM